MACLYVMSVAQLTCVTSEGGWDSPEQVKRTLYSLALKSCNPVIGMKLLPMHTNTRDQQFVQLPLTEGLCPNN